MTYKITSPEELLTWLIRAQAYEKYCLTCTISRSPEGYTLEKGGFSASVATASPGMQQYFSELISAKNKNPKVGKSLVSMINLFIGLYPAARPDDTAAILTDFITWVAPVWASPVESQVRFCAGAGNVCFQLMPGRNHNFLIPPSMVIEMA